MLTVVLETATVILLHRWPATSR